MGFLPAVRFVKLYDRIPRKDLGQARIYDNDLLKAEHEVIRISLTNPPIPPSNDSHQGCFLQERKPSRLDCTAGRYMCVLDLQDERGLTMQSDCCLRLQCPTHIAQSCNTGSRGSGVWQCFTHCTLSLLHEAARLPCLCQTDQPEAFVQPPMQACGSNLIGTVFCILLCFAEAVVQFPSREKQTAQRLNELKCLALRLHGWRIKCL